MNNEVKNFEIRRSEFGVRNFTVLDE